MAKKLHRKEDGHLLEGYHENLVELDELLGLLKKVLQREKMYLGQMAEKHTRDLVDQAARSIHNSGLGEEAQQTMEVLAEMMADGHMDAEELADMGGEARSSRPQCGRKGRIWLGNLPRRVPSWQRAGS